VRNITPDPYAHKSGSMTIISGVSDLIEDSFGPQPISIGQRDKMTANLILETSESIKKLVINYLDKKYTIKVKKVDSIRQL